MYCPNCGAEISDDSKFCMNCGYKLHSDNSQTTYTEQPVQVNNYYVEPQKKKSGLFILFYNTNTSKINYYQHFKD